MEKISHHKSITNRTKQFIIVGLLVLFTAAGTYFVFELREPLKLETQGIVMDGCAFFPSNDEIVILQLAQPATRKVGAKRSNRSIAHSSSEVPGQIRGSASFVAEINFFNQDKTFSFDNNFHSGSASKSNATILRKKMKNGYVLNLKSSSFVATPSYYEGMLYVSGGFNSRSYFAINAKTGELSWATNLSDDGPSSAIVTDSMIIFNTESCTIFALNRRNGQQIWSKYIGDPLLSHPVSDGKNVYTAYPSISIHGNSKGRSQFKHIKPSHPFAAFDVQTGAVVWRRWLDGDVMTSPVLSNGKVYLTTFSGTLYKLRAEDGQIQQASGLRATSLPTVVGDRIYITQRRQKAGKIYEAVLELNQNLSIRRTIALHPAPYLDYALMKGGDLKKQASKWDLGNGFFTPPNISGWQNATKLVGQANVSALQNFVGSTIVYDQNHLYTTMGDTIRCFNLEKGEAVWAYGIEGNLLKEGGHLATMPLVANDFVVSVSYDGKVLLLDKVTGKLAKSYATNTYVRNQPVIVDGNIFVASTTGELSCIETKNEALDGWPMFLRNNGHDCAN